MKESAARKINTSIWFCWMKKKTSSLIEDKITVYIAMYCTFLQRGLQNVKKKRKDKAQSSLLLLQKMVAMCCKFYIWPPVNVLLYFMLFCILYGLVLFRKGDFSCVKCL